MRTDSVKEEYLEFPREFARIQLDRNWLDCRDYKVATNDFRRVLGVNIKKHHGPRPELDVDFGKGATIMGFPYLCPLKEFMENFDDVQGLKTVLGRVSVGMPGFPHRSLFYHSYDGHFGNLASKLVRGSKADQEMIALKFPKKGRYNIVIKHKALTDFLAEEDFNRMYVVTDEWDQVGAIQFTDETVKGVSIDDDGDLKIYNFVQFRRKGSGISEVTYRTVNTREGLVICTLLMVGDELKEVNVLLLPKPTLQLVKYALSFE
jgi:hypothetical protein